MYLGTGTVPSYLIIERADGKNEFSESHSIKVQYVHVLIFMSTGLEIIYQ